jgi:phosphopantetheine--protein transferase-like protein
MSQILGIGTDIVQVERFKKWESFSKEKLLKIFSEKELEYCSISVRMVRQAHHERLNLEKVPVRPELVEGYERFNLEGLASRFAAKEAFFKALSASLVNLKKTQTTFSFLFACQNVETVQDEWQVPKLNVDWKAFGEKIEVKLPKFQAHLSISHEKNYSVAFVILSI